MVTKLISALFSLKSVDMDLNDQNNNFTGGNLDVEIGC